MIEEKTGSAPSAPTIHSSDGGSSDDDIVLSNLADPHPPAIPVKNRKQRAHDNAKNNSALCRPASGKTKSKKGSSGKSAKDGQKGGGGRTSMVQRRPVNGQERGGRKSSTKRANPLLGRLQALGRSRGVQSRSDGVGDFNIPGYESSLCDLKPEGVPAETAAIESHNIPRDGQDPSAI